MQERFMKLFSRRMTARDMQAWSAARMIGESARDAPIDDAKAMFDFLKSPDFALAAFKGQRLTLRDWNLQLPAHPADRRANDRLGLPAGGVPASVSELDTLGFDRPETKCKLK